MAVDPLEMLAQQEVPPVPADLDARLHQRLNEMLLASHIGEFAGWALPSAAGGLLDGLVHLVEESLPKKKNRDADEDK